MNVGFSEKLLARGPAPSGGRVHHLHKAAMTTPGDDEMGDAIGEADHHNCRQHSSLREQHVVNRHHDLLRREAELGSDLFHRINGSPVHIGLAGLTEAAVTNGDTEALEEAFERRRTAVHSRGLHNLRHKEAAAYPGGVSSHGISHNAVRAERSPTGEVEA